MNSTKRRGLIRVVIGDPPMIGNFIFMNAPRPLTGSYYLADPGNTAPYAREGQFVVAIDMDDSSAEAYIENNRNMDACCLVFMSKDRLRLIGFTELCNTIMFGSKLSIDEQQLSLIGSKEICNTLHDALCQVLRTLPGDNENGT